VDFGGTVLSSNTGSNDVFVAKYAANCGALQWIRSFGSSGNDFGYGLAVDAGGNLIVTGYFSGSADFGAGLTLSNGPFADVFIAKYAASNGAYLWAHTLYGPSIDAGRAAAVDRDGNIILAGSFQLSVADGTTFAPLFTGVGSADIYMIKFAPNGAYLWWRSFGSDGEDVAYGVAVDSGGNIALAGTFQNTLSLGGTPLVTAGLSDGFVAKFSPMGNHLWSRGLGGTGAEYDYAVAMDGAGNVVMTGAFQNSVTFNGGSLTSAGRSDILVAKYSATGVPLWSRSYGDANDDMGYGVAVDGSGNVFVTGYFQGSTDFGGGSVTSAGSSIDGFLLKLAP
jgi:hypothetical protein